MNDELKNKLYALIGGLVSGMLMRDMAPELMLYFAELLPDVEELIERETGVHMTINKYVAIAKEESFQQAMKSEHISEEKKQQIRDLKDAADAFANSLRTLTEDVPPEDENIEVKDDDDGPFARFLRDMKDEDFLQ